LFSLKKESKQQQISPSISVLLFELISAVIYENNCRVGQKQKFWIRHSRILSICWISEKCRTPLDSDSESVTSLLQN